MAWWGDDQTYRSTKLDSDLRVGGKWRTEGKSKDGKEFSVFGQYTRVEPPNALAFTWNHGWGGADMPETHVLVELMPTSSGTHVTVTHSGFTTRQSATRTTRAGGACWAGCSLTCNANKEPHP